MKNEYMDNLEMFLEQRIKNMDVFIGCPNLATKADFGYKPLPLIKIGYINNDEEFKQFCRINALLNEYFQKEQKVLKIGKALELIGKKVIKHSKKPFKSGQQVVEACGIIVHPYKPGWHLAYTFMDDDSCVAIEQVKEFRGE